MPWNLIRHAASASTSLPLLQEAPQVLGDPCSHWTSCGRGSWKNTQLTVHTFSWEGGVIDAVAVLDAAGCEALWCREPAMNGFWVQHSPGREGLLIRGVAPCWAILLMPPFCSALNCFLPLFWKGVSCCLMAPQRCFINVIKISGVFWKEYFPPCIRSHSTAGMYGGRDGRGSQELITGR